MAKSCVYTPKTKAGQKLLGNLKKDFQHGTAAYIYNRVVSPEFINKYKDSLILDEGIPTYESVMANPAVINYIGKDNMLTVQNNKQPHLPNTIENVSQLIEEANNFNNNNDKYVAYVDYDSDNNLTLKIDFKNEASTNIAENQRKIQKLNERISEILTPIGITIGTLSNWETSVGRVGVTNFNKAVEAANGLASMMAIANNMEGHGAISEEFAHFLIGVFKDNSLVQRSLNALNNEEIAREILGDQYNKVSEYYNGDSKMIAEEALGHILRDTLLEVASNANLYISNNKFKNLFKRAIDYIIRLFKPYNPVSINEAILYVNSDMSNFAQKILKGQTAITKKDIEASKRVAIFNALSEKAEAQIQVLKKIEERAYKNIFLQQDLEGKKQVRYKKRSSIFASSIHNIFNSNFKEEESMAAIASYLELSNLDLNKMYEELNNIENLSPENRFTLLRNVQYTLQAYAPTIKDLKDITESQYLQDEHIANQKYVIGDSNNALEEYEVREDIEPIDTKGMSLEDIVKQIIKDSEEWELSEDESHYIHKTIGDKAIRVTQIVSSSLKEKTFDKNNPWYTPSTNIGTGKDEFVRDFLSGRVKENNGVFLVEGKDLDEVYPNASKEALTKLANKLKKFKAEQDAKGITLIPRGVTVNGVITSLESNGKPHKINAVGTLDLLGYDADGNWYVYDIKTFRSDIDEDKKNKYAQQVTLYKDFLEQKYGIKVKEMAILPIQVSYPAPSGAEGGNTDYTVSNNKPEEYKGKKSNQLIVNGRPFKDSNPTLQDLMPVTEKKTNVSYSDLGGVEEEDNIKKMLDTLVTMDRLYVKLNNLFKESSSKYFIEYLKTFVGENIKIREIDENGNFTGKLVESSIKTLIEKSPKDATILQRWVTTMADNPDAFLQIYDKIVNEAKHEKRFKVLEKSKEILALGKEYEAKGITSYDWMFEEDKKNYISHREINGIDYSYDKSAYEKAKKEYIQELNEQYGEFPDVGSSEYEAKQKFLLEWIRSNTITIEEEFENNLGKKDTRAISIPSPYKYPSKYNSLSEIQKEFYNKWMSIKEELDSYLPNDVTKITSTIKIRKSGYERFTDAIHGNAINTFIESVKSSVMQSYDDDFTYNRGMKDFDGKQVMRLPLFYINANETQDITTDVIGSLIAYTDMVYNYDAMSKIVNPLEIGRYLAENKREINKTANSKRIYEEFSYGTKIVKNPLYEDNTSNFLAILNDFMESKVYGKYLQDSGSTTIKGKQLDNNKIAGRLLQLGSTVQLGFNGLAGLANAATGIAMQNIEAAAGEFFNARELASADKEFITLMPGYLGDIGQRIKTNKLSLFYELLDIKLNYSKTIKDKNFLNRTILGRVFGPNMQYIFQEAGDLWLYGRSGIAIALRTKVLLNGEEISFWDALEEEDIIPGNPDLGKRLVVKEGVTNLDGSEFTQKDIAAISNRIGYINRHCFGVYDNENSIAARRTIWGRFLMQYRDWIPAQIRYRFGSKTTNLNKGEGEVVEGYYRTFGRFVKNVYEELKYGEMTIGQVWDNLDDYEKANLKRVGTETLQLLGVYIIAGLLKGSKDKDREYSWARNTVGYMFTRLRTELGALHPISIPREMLKIVKSPFAATSVFSDLYNVRLLLDPRNYFDEIQSGDFKGHSSAYRAFMRSPLTLYYRTIKRQLDPEKAEQFYDNK